MSDSQTSPLLAAEAESSTTTTERPSSTKSKRSDPSPESLETTPLLSRVDTNRYDGDDEDQTRSPAESSLRTLRDRSPSKPKSKLPVVISIIVLSLLTIVILAGGFLAPAAVEEYAKQAIVIEPTHLSVDSFTPTGVRARIQADFRLDASRVRDPAIRRVGQAATWVASKVESQPTELYVYLPEYDNIVVGSASVPGIVVSIRDGHTTHIDFLADLLPGDVIGLRNVANDWLQGRLTSLRVQGKTNVALKSGMIPLGTQTIVESMVFEGDTLPSLPAYHLSDVNLTEMEFPDGKSGVSANVSLSVVNDYPLALEVPPLGFDILVGNCHDDQPYIQVAQASTQALSIRPNEDVQLEVSAVVREIPAVLTKVCPNSHNSPLDVLLGDYVHGLDTTIFVRGSSAPQGETPDWITDLISSVTVPVPFPGHTFDDAIKNFTLRDVHFSLPDPTAPEDSPDANPKVSGVIQVIAEIPKELNVGLNITRVRAKADVFYQGDKMGVLDVMKWQPANSTRLDATDQDTAKLMVEANIEDGVLYVTDDEIFSKVMQALLFGGKPVMLEFKAAVDAKLDFVLGKLVVKELPAEGMVPIKAPSIGGFPGALGSINPHIGDLSIVDTTRTSISLSAKVNFTNPTNYTASVPFLGLHIVSNGSILGEVQIRDASIGLGNNTNLKVQALWDPKVMGGDKARRAGRDLISQYISGWNTTITIQTFNGTIPTQPRLGEALSKFPIDIPAPKLSDPSDGDEDDDGPHFIKDALFHLFSSTAVFTLKSPLQETTLFIDNVNATAIYNHTEPVGHILYDDPFAIPAAELYETPRLPVEWSPGSVGYDAMRKALGGTLKLDASATIGVRLGQWTEEIWFVGGGIGARVRL